MDTDRIDRAIDFLETALSDLRWVGRGGKEDFYLPKIRAAIMRAEDCLDHEPVK